MIAVNLGTFLLGVVLTMMVYDGMAHEWRANTFLVIALCAALMVISTGLILLRMP